MSENLRVIGGTDMKKNENEKMGLLISQMMIMALLWISIYTFFNQDAIVAKVFSAIGCIGFLYLLTSSLKWRFKVFVQNKTS